MARKEINNNVCFVAFLTFQGQIAHGVASLGGKHHMLCLIFIPKMTYFFKILILLKLKLGNNLCICANTYKENEVGGSVPYNTLMLNMMWNNEIASASQALYILKHEVGHLMNSIVNIFYLKYFIND